jgi:hypothetical protein
MGLSATVMEWRWSRHNENYMLLMVGAVIVVITVVVILRMRIPGAVNDSPLGSMSERWLAEHRSSHSA